MAGFISRFKSYRTHLGWAKKETTAIPGESKRCRRTMGQIRKGTDTDISWYLSNFDWVHTSTNWSYHESKDSHARYWKYYIIINQANNQLVLITFYLPVLGTGTLKITNLVSLNAKLIYKKISCQSYILLIHCTVFCKISKKFVTNYIA